MPETSIVVKITANDSYSEVIEVIKKLSAVTKAFDKDVDALNDALIRLCDLNFTQAGQRSLTAENVQPEQAEPRALYKNISFSCILENQPVQKTLAFRIRQAPLFKKLEKRGSLLI